MSGEHGKRDLYCLKGEGEMKLLPCPFCGNEPRVNTIIPFGQKEITAHSISCGGPCLLQMVTTGIYLGHKDRAAYAWNTRDGEEELCKKE